MVTAVQELPTPSVRVGETITMLDDGGRRTNVVGTVISMATLSREVLYGIRWLDGTVSFATITVHRGTKACPRTA